MVYMVEGILQVYSRELETRTEKVKQMPAGDEKAIKMEVIERLKGLLASVDAALFNNKKPDKILDEVEIHLDKLK